MFVWACVCVCFFVLCLACHRSKFGKVGGAGICAMRIVCTFLWRSPWMAMSLHNMLGGQRADVDIIPVDTHAASKHCCDNVKVSTLHLKEVGCCIVYFSLCLHVPSSHVEWQLSWRRAFSMVLLCIIADVGPRTVLAVLQIEVHGTSQS